MKLAEKILKYVINALMIAACVMALTGIATGPVWAVKATVFFNEELADRLSNMISDGSSSENSGETSSGTSDGSLSGEEIFRQAIDEMVKDKVKVPVSLKFSNGSFVSSIFDKNGQVVDDLIDGMVDEAFGEEFRAEVEKVKKSATKGATKVMVKQAVLDFKNSSEEASELFKNKTADEILADAGLTGRELDEKIDAVYDVLTQGKTVADAADSVTEVVKEVYDKLKDSDIGRQNPDIFKDIDANAEEIKKEVSKVLVAISMVGSGDITVEDIGKIEVTDEMLAEGMNNTVDLSGIFDKILLESLKGMLGSDAAPDTAPEDENERSGEVSVGVSGNVSGEVSSNTLACCGVTAFGMLRISAGPASCSVNDLINGKKALNQSSGTDKPAEGEDVYEEIKTMLKTKFKSAVPDEYKEGIVWVMRIIAITILINALVWVYLIVKLVLNTIRGRGDTKIKIVTLFGWETGFNLVVLPTILFRLFTTENAVSSAIGIPIGEISKSVGISFASGSIFAFYATIAVFGLWIVRKILNTVFKEI